MHSVMVVIEQHDLDEIKLLLKELVEDTMRI